MLAVLWFLYRTCKWQDKWPEKKKKIMIHCDSLSLVQRINWHFKRITLTPNNVTAADYDLEAGITSTIDLLQEKNFAIKVKHVKGHQDRKTAADMLHKAQRMNVEADKEATSAMTTHSFTSKYSAIPMAQTMLYIQGKPITSKAPQTLRRAYLSQGLREYMIQREKWAQSTPEQIC